MRLLHFILGVASLAHAASVASQNHAPSPRRIIELFQPYTAGNATQFYQDVVSPQVHWTVTGTGRVAGAYTSLAEFLDAIAPIGQMLAGPLYLDVLGVTTGETVMADGEDSHQWAVVELRTRNGTLTKSGSVYNNQYSWVTKWENERIIEVRAYLDTLELERALIENEGL